MSMDTFVDERDFSLLEHDRYTFFVLRRIIGGSCHTLLSNHENLIICYTGEPYPVWIWTVDGAPIDFTYLEYALLAFLVTHPDRTYSRDALLKRVWGFDYYGGTRTVDVHVRRVRAKLGPDLAQHLETVRGVGYLWNG